MKKYIIKVTYLEGIHKGETYLLNKGGYVVDNPEYVWQDSSYTLSACKAVCTRYKKMNDRNVEIERRNREYAISKSRTVSKYAIYIPKVYDPFEIETVDR